VKKRIVPIVVFAGAGALGACLVAATPASADPTGPSLSDSVPPVPAPPAPAITRGTVALAAAGVALAGAGAALVFGVLALQNKHDFDGSPTYAGADRGNNDAAYADGGVALAVSAGITSLVLWLTRDKAQDEPAPGQSAKPSVNRSASVVLTPYSGGAGALVRF
jgi:hypothetical protein